MLDNDSNNIDAVNIERTPNHGLMLTAASVGALGVAGKKAAAAQA
jgi:hypothetical protein